VSSYRRDVCLEKAKALLRDTAVPIKTIAGDPGFTGVGHSGRSFEPRWRSPIGFSGSNSRMACWGRRSEIVTIILSVWRSRADSAAVAVPVSAG